MRCMISKAVYCFHYHLILLIIPRVCLIKIDAYVFTGLRKIVGIWKHRKLIFHFA